MTHRILGAVAALALVAAPISAFAQNDRDGLKTERRHEADRPERGDAGRAGMDQPDRGSPDARQDKLDEKAERKQERKEEREDRKNDAVLDKPRDAAKDGAARSDKDAEDNAASDRASGDRPQRDGSHDRDRPSASFSVDQRTTVRRTIVTTEVRRVPRASLHVALSIGAPLPRTVIIDRLPPRIIEIVPEYRNYSYFVTDDDEIIIVDPLTYAIIDIIEP